MPEKEVKEHLGKIATGQVHAYLLEINNDCVGFATFYLGLPENLHHYEEMLEITAYFA